MVTTLGDARRLDAIDVGADLGSWWPWHAGGSMISLRNAALSVLICLAVSGWSCTEGEDPETEAPSDADLREIAMAHCQQAVECQMNPAGVTLAECIDNRLGSYLADSECIASYHLDECLLEMSCQDIDFLLMNFDGECSEELEEYNRVSPCLSP